MNINLINEIKGKYNLSNNDLSVATGLSIGYINSICSGDVQNIPIEDLSKICGFLHIDIKDMYNKKYKEEEIKQLIISEYGSLSKFADKIGLSTSTLSRIFREGFSTATFSKMKIIFKELNISLDTMQLKEDVENEGINNDIIELISNLNIEGIEKIKSYAEDLLLIDKYRVKENE